MSRQIRVFLSSTFRDMQAEREALIKLVFPGLRRMCRRRGVDLVEVDLRWGITEAQAERGEVLPLCIREIDRCVPYFIGILGARYGSVPERLPDAEWAVPDASITHMEIHWAALRPGAKTDRAFFYFRRDAVGPAPQEALKASIRDRGLSVEDYSDPDELAERVESALRAAIDEDYPEAAERTWLDLEREAMDTFLASRSQVYVARPEWFALLDDPRPETTDGSSSNAASVVVTGTSGSGKSALLANWAAQTSARTFVHFCGATPHSATPERIVLRLLFELGASVSEDVEDHVAQVGPCLAAAAPIVLVIDAVEHLEDLSWLPHPLPDRVRVIASGRPSKALDDLVRRGYQTLTLTPLTVDERRQIVVTALAHHGKTLSDARLDTIVSAAPTENPLYLRTLVEELRLWGDHEALDALIARILEAPDVPTLFARVLARLEADYEADHEGLVGAALSALAAARRGLTETELLEVIEAPPLVWAPLDHALEASLMNRGGVLTFFHDGLRQAVLQRYLPDEAALWSKRSALVAYFCAQPMDDRVAEELPWLQDQIDDDEGLTESLTNLDLFLYLQDEAELQDVVRWWQKVPTDPAEGYGQALTAYSEHAPSDLEHAGVVHRVARFLQMVARLDAALPLFEEATRRYEAALEPSDRQLGIMANDHALALFIAGHYQQAEPLFRRALDICGETPGVLHNLAEILLRKNELPEAEDIAGRAVAAYRSTLGRHELTATAMQNLARARMERGDLDGADAAFTEALSMVEGPPTRALALALSNLGNLRLRQGRLQEAESALRRSITASKEVLGPTHPHASATLGTLASTLYFAGRQEEAEAAYLEAIRLIENGWGPEHPNLTHSLVAIANLYIRWNRTEAAEVYAKRAFVIAQRALGPRSIDAGNALLSLSACAAQRQSFDEAVDLAFKACAIHDETLGGDHPTTDRSWGMIIHLGRTLLEAGDAERAEPLLRASFERQERRLGPRHPQLGPHMWNLGRALAELDRVPEALPYFERELALLEATKGPDHEETMGSRQNLHTLQNAVSGSGQDAG